MDWTTKLYKNSYYTCEKCNVQLPLNYSHDVKRGQKYVCTIITYSNRPGMSVFIINNVEHAYKRLKNIYVVRK